MKGDKGDTGTVDTSNFYDKTASDARFLRTLATNTAAAANGAEMLAAHSCKQTGILYGSPNGLVATPLIQAGTQTRAPIRVCNITASPIDIDGLQYISIALRP